MRMSVVALEVERTFWEKATILHAEFHRPEAHVLRDRSARHYADFAALWQHSSSRAALARRDLLADVVRHKERFFASAWANYEAALHGALRLTPPRHRMLALRQDFERMAPMFLSAPPSFEEVLADLAVAESVINGR